jgi:hypothetical protein
MNIEMTLMPLCNKCDNRSITVGDGGRPLWSRHEWLSVTAPRIRAHTRELATNSEIEPEAVPSDSEDNLVGAVMESIGRSLDTIEDSVLGIEAAVDRIGPSRETVIDLQFVLRNMFHDVAEISSKDTTSSDQLHRLGIDQISAMAS